jgi:tetratricopeptide (TPR) repeat protein
MQFTMKSENNHRKFPILLGAIALAVLAGCGSDEPEPQEAVAVRAPAPAISQIALQDMAACADDLAPVLSDAGTYRRSIRTAMESTQVYFDQGLRLTYSYYFPEAIASFNAALCFEPGNPMILWGKALASGPNPNSRYGAAPDDPMGTGRNAINAAMAARNTRPEAEQGLIEALAPLFDTDTYPDTAARTQAFIDAAETNYANNPDDLEAAFLVAHGIMMSTPWTYYDQDDGSAMPGVERALEVMETGMEQNPAHPGLTHLHIHLLEASLEPGRAEDSADRLESLTPMAGHMVHMPGHIYMRLGRYQDAINTNQRSLSADDEVVAAWGNRALPRTGTDSLSATNHGGHATMFIHWAGILQGNSERALAISGPMAAMADPEALAEGRGLRNLVAHWMTLRAFGQFDELLALENPAPDQPYLAGMLNYMHGSAYLNQDDIDAAQAEYDNLQELRNEPVLDSQRAAVNTTADMLAVASYALAGEIASARGNYDEAIQAFRQAVALQDALRYMEPPDWLQSMRLFLGQAHLDAGEYNQAINVFERDLILLQENGWALYGLTEALEQLGETEEADLARQRLLMAWKDADVILTDRAHF